jgi:imidazolonepropionase-like amidohydrolase
MAITPVAAQERPNYDVQLPIDGGTYPTGSLFIANLDTVWTAAGDPIAGASILIRDGIIRQIGVGIRAPDNVTVIDGNGLHAMPGIVDEHSHIAMAATNEGTAPVVPEVRVVDALDPESFGLYQALSGGVTTARVMHGSSNPIGGQSAVIKTRWGMERGEQLLIPGAPRFVKFALGENVTRKGSQQSASSRFPRSRQGVEATYVAAFTAAQAYKTEWDRYRADPSTFRVAPRRDLRLEALVDIMEGRIRIHAHSYRSDEILMLMRVAERFGFKIDVFTHVLEGYRVATEMAEHGAAGSTFSDWWQYKREAFDAIPYNAAIMHQHGVLTGLNSDIPWLQSFMHLEIPKPVKYGGVSQLDALRMLTLNPARMMYLDDRIGSLEDGKEADVVLLTASPFSSYARVERTIVDGIVYYDASDEPATRDQPFNVFEDVAPVAPTAPMTSARGATESPPARLDNDAATEPNGDGGAQTDVVALIGGTIHPVAGPPIANGTLVIADGRIQAVGTAQEVSVPAGARRVDVSGRHVYPGMIDPVTSVGLTEFGQVGQATDQGELGEFNPHIRALVGVMPYYPTLDVARANGITSVMTAQTSGVVQGTAAVIAFNDGDTWERVAVKPEVALMVNFPAPRERGGDASNWRNVLAEGDLHGGNPAAEVILEQVEAEARIAAQQEDEEDEGPKLTGTRMEELVTFFKRARVYTTTPSVSDDPTDPFEVNVWGGESVLMDPMIPVMRGERPVFFRADSKWQIETLFVFADSFPELRPVIVGGSEAWKVADKLAARRIPVIITTAYTPTGNMDESIASNFRNASVLEAAGVQFAFGTASDADVRNLPYHAARSVAFGLSREAGLRAVTLAPAQILGLDAGSLEVGKRADVIVTDGDPLEMLTTVERVWVGGWEVDPRDNKHARLFQEFRNR